MSRVTDAVPLTQLSSCAGCAAKLSQSQLGALLREMGRGSGDAAAMHRGVLVGAHTFDDAGVYQLRPNLALVQTVDFFTPIVDDPYDFGQIAAANALSDVYAMGGRPLTAMNLLGVPVDKLSPAVIARILRGGQDKTREVNCVLIGGHTIRSPEPVYGLSVTGTVHPRRILTNAAARPGDLLVLTKPLGAGITTTAIKRGLASIALKRRVVGSMKRVNGVGAMLGEAKLVNAATDVTGFGLLGHLGNIVRGSGVAAEIHSEAVPTFGAELLRLISAGCVPGGTRTNLESAQEMTTFAPDVSPEQRLLLADAQTSGGLLLCVAPRKQSAVLEMLKASKTLSAAVIGQIRRGRPRIDVR